MDEELRKELLTLRQAIARLSDRLEETEKQLRSIKRERRAEPALSAETDAQIQEIPLTTPLAKAPKPEPAAPAPAPKTQAQDDSEAAIGITPIDLILNIKPEQEPTAISPKQQEVSAIEDNEHTAEAEAASRQAPEPEKVFFQAENPAPNFLKNLPGAQAEPEPHTEAKAEEPHKPRENVELNIGKYWLNKIGIGMFVLGVGFLIAYSSRYFGLMGPWGKIATGCIASAALFWTGSRFRKNEKLVNFGYVLSGGGWALAYFTAFAMHHFPQSRVIESQAAGLVLLAGVAAAMLLYSLKYRSEALSGIAVFVGYITATLGDVQYFTLLSCAVQAAVILVLVRKFRWVRMLFMGIGMTYSVHFFWVYNHLEPSARSSFFLLHATFLTLYWAFFTAGTHLLASSGERRWEGRLAAAATANTLFYFLLLFPDLTRLFPEERFSFLLALGGVLVTLSAVMYRAGARKMYACDVLMGLAVATLAVPLKYLPPQASLVWLVELPFLYYFGAELKSRTLRGAAFLLFLWTLLHYPLFVTGRSAYAEFMLVGAVPMEAVTAFAMALSYAAVFTLSARAFEAGKISEGESLLSRIYPAAAVCMLYAGTEMASASANLTLYIFADSLLIFCWGMFAKEAPIRVYSCLMLGLGILRFAAADNYHALAAARRWAYIGCEILCGYAIYFLYRKLRETGKLQAFEHRIVTAVAAGSGLLVLAAVLRYVPEQWVTFTLAMLSLAVFALAGLTSSVSLRFTAAAGFTLAAARLALIDTFEPVTFADWAVVSFVPLTQAAHFLLYRRMRDAGEVPEEERPVCAYSYALFQFTLMSEILLHAAPSAATPLLSVMNLALFAAGCALKESVVRWGSAFIMPLALLRFTFSDYYAVGARALPLTAVLGSYYALSIAAVRAQARGLLSAAERHMPGAACGMSAILTLAALWKYAPDAWAAAAMAGLGLAALAHGCLRSSLNTRMSGLLLISAATFKSCVIDNYAPLGSGLLWLPPLTQALSAATAYWMYRRARLGNILRAHESLFQPLLFAETALLISVSIIRYGTEFWVCAPLALTAAALFFAARAMDEAPERVIACAVFAPMLLTPEPYHLLGQGTRWLALGVQYGSLLAVYTAYKSLLRAKEPRSDEGFVAVLLYVSLLAVLLLHMSRYSPDEWRAAAFTAAYLLLFLIGLKTGDTPLRLSWLALVPAAGINMALYAPKFESAPGELACALFISGGLYAVYLASPRRREGLNSTEGAMLGLLCLFAAAMTEFCVWTYVQPQWQTMLASALLLGLYLLGLKIKDPVFSMAAFVCVPFILLRRGFYDVYSPDAPLMKWAVLLSPPTAFMGIYLSRLAKLPQEMSRVPVPLGLVPGMILLAGAIGFQAEPSLRTLSFGVAGLACFLPGFRFNDKPLRWCGLMFFTLVMARIALVDIARLPIIYKIITFILLGLILLGVSYVYTRFMNEEKGAAE